jgi:hypothetical protein
VQTVKISCRNWRSFFVRRSWHHAGNPRRPRRLYRVLAESLEKRQARDLHRRQPRAEGRRLSQRAATADPHRARRRHAGGRIGIDREGGRADDRRGFLVVYG